MSWSWKSAAALTKGQKPLLGSSSTITSTPPLDCNENKSNESDKLEEGLKSTRNGCRTRTTTRNNQDPFLTPPNTNNRRRRWTSSSLREHQRPDGNFDHRQTLPLYHLDKRNCHDEQKDEFIQQPNDDIENMDDNNDNNSLDVDSKHRPRRHRLPTRSQSWNPRMERSQTLTSTLRLTSHPLISPTRMPTSRKPVTLVEGKSHFRTMTRIFMTGNILQVMLLIGVVSLLVLCRSRADFTASTLRRLQQEESFSLLHLHNIEQRSLLLHDNIRGRLRQAGILDETGDDPLEPQRIQLEQMTNELNEHVKALQHDIQQDARDQIVRTFGEGPVKVVIEFDFGGADSGSHDDELQKKPNDEGHQVLDKKGPTSVSIVLWPDTPHAAWVWLEQIERNVWDDSMIGWDTATRELQLTPSRSDPLRRGLLEFVEPHDSSNTGEKDNKNRNLGMNHDAWTIGLRQRMLSSNETLSLQSERRLEMFINLSDNQKSHKHETCIGKLLGGYDTLQRILSAARFHDKTVTFTSLRIRKVSAMHVAYSELKQLHSQPMK